ncbi:MAG: ATP12 family protein [Pseudomonadota bacterium]
MSDWAPRKFWTDVTARPEGEGWAVYLDDRPLRTPAKAALIAPTPAMAEAVAEEWRAQDETIDPGSMPVTRSLNVVLDKIVVNPAPVADMLAGYAETDLLCYRATQPDALVARQAEAWDPHLDWAADTYGARLVTTAGVMPVTQPADAVVRLARAVHDLDPYDLAAAHDLVTLSGSLILGLAAMAGRIDAETLWAAARLDESWQIEQWGPDEEAESLAATKKEAVLHALAFQALAKKPA